MHYCTPHCFYFPQEVPEEDVLEEKTKQGITCRKVIRRCGYDNTTIKSWEHRCPRPDGPKEI